MIADFAAALTKIANQFLTTIELRTGRLIAVEITNQTNAERDVVQIIAVDVAAINLPAPAIANFDLAVAGRSAVADHEMVSEPVLHSAKMPVVVIERGSVALTCSAVVHDDILPAAARDRRAINLITDRSRQITITRAATAALPAATE